MFRRIAKSLEVAVYLTTDSPAPKTFSSGIATSAAFPNQPHLEIEKVPSESMLLQMCSWECVRAWAQGQRPAITVKDPGAGEKEARRKEERVHVKSTVGNGERTGKNVWRLVCFVIIEVVVLLKWKNEIKM